MSLAKTEKKLKTPQKLSNLPSRYKVVYLHVYNIYRGSCLTLHILSTTTYLHLYRCDDIIYHRLDPELRLH